MRTEHGKAMRTEFLMQTQALSLQQVTSFQYEFVALVALVMKLDHSEAVQNGAIMKLLIQLCSSYAQMIHLVVGEQGSTLRQVTISYFRLMHSFHIACQDVQYNVWSILWNIILCCSGYCDGALECVIDNGMFDSESLRPGPPRISS